ncbi:Oidioi.mRNA.OKI2018_I69.PAR.g10421.t1.cds [Oikopleura dioica]|uniref:Oidioi.mRNA.OKI2018_I69.PAR.g10421.t1.cds n=1 Tax=Oikopleura dioica TaxID=34765 RepID=A0ABN7RRE0_OIKDI|nr:Oidioi.mRNA.OKI2018_I69.PAR.g10421.t1.cds [Oikopleura dioica]
MTFLNTQELAIIVSLSESNQQAAFAASECPVHFSDTSSNHQDQKQYVEELYDYIAELTNRTYRRRKKKTSTSSIDFSEPNSPRCPRNNIMLTERLMIPSTDTKCPE